MRMLKALLISLPSGITAFFLTLGALDAGFPELWPAAPASRVAQFAAPRLEEASPASLASLRPIQVIKEAAASASPGLQPDLMALIEEPRAITRSVRVPPVARRAPVDPQPDAMPTSVVAEAKPEPAAPAVARPSVPMDTSTRSALGGPRPVPPTPPAKASEKTAVMPAGSSGTVKPAIRTAAKKTAQPVRPPEVLPSPTP
ncbi:MAG: hypothetical protein JSS20_17745 [Proteobacteria bacterium]|nr:hypothetical protein [Pseudomonadota bacterium]